MKIPHKYIDQAGDQIDRSFQAHLRTASDGESQELAFQKFLQHELVSQRAALLFMANQMGLHGIVDRRDPNAPSCIFGKEG